MMDGTLSLIFWVLVFIVIYDYVAYPFLLKILNNTRSVITTKFLIAYPSLTIIIAAYNEEKIINDKIKNTIELDYPQDKLEIIVASDASTDSTNEIVKKYEKAENDMNRSRVVLNLQTERKGKSTILNDTVLRVAKGEIVIFTDATTFLKEDAIKKLVRNFSDVSIGAVCGKLSFVNQEDSSISKNEGFYWRYEEFLRKNESQIGVLPFVSGAFYGIRKHLYTPVKEGLPDDSVSPLSVYKNGYRVVFEEEAIAYEEMASTTEGEFRIKSRGAVRELGAILSFKELLNPFKYPMLSWVLFSHRLLRWSVGFFLIGIFLTNLMLLSSYIYRITLWCQIVFYSLALIGYLFTKGLRNWKIFALPFYFCLVNIAAMWGIIQFLFGKKTSVWEPVRD